MSKPSPTREFDGLIERIVEGARLGTLLTEALYQEALERLPEPGTDENLEALAIAIRRLHALCGWDNFEWALGQIASGVSPDCLHLELTRLEEKSRVRTDEESIADKRIVERLISNRRYLADFVRRVRPVEVMMGFDQEATDTITKTLGNSGWDSTPNSFIDLLPEKLRFSLLRASLSGPYDHRIHLLVERLASCLGDKWRSNDVVIRHCGQALVEVLGQDRKESVGIVLKQAVLVADAYVDERPWNVVALCWRGQLAIIEGNDVLASEMAKRVWRQTADASAETINRVVSFLADVQISILDAGESWWVLGRSRYNLALVSGSWMGSDLRFASALLRRAFQKGDWDNSLLCSAFWLRDFGFELEPEDAPLECWIWWAENVHHSDLDEECYYYYWINAYATLSEDTDPRLAHNVLSVLLTASLHTDLLECHDHPSIQELLSKLESLHRAGSMMKQKSAALEMIKHVFQQNPEHLTAADRLAMAKAIQELEKPALRTPPTAPAFLEPAEVWLKSKVGDDTWAKLSPNSMREFKMSEFLYNLEQLHEGETGNSDTFIMHASKGLLLEIQESLRGPLVRDPSLKREFLGLFGKTHPEWSELISFMTNLDGIASTTLVKRLLAQGVVLSRLRELREPFERIMSCRNKAAHTKDRVDREEAAVLRDLIWNKEGLVQNVVEFFPRTRRR